LDLNAFSDRVYSSCECMLAFSEKIFLEKVVAVSTLKRQLSHKFHSRQARVAVIGLGYVGLPLAIVFAEVGYEVVGIDVDAAKVDAINRGESYISDIPSERLAALVRGNGEAARRRGDEVVNGLFAASPHRDADLKLAPDVQSGRQSAALSPGRLSATTDFSMLADCDAVSICVPTPLRKTGDPDISYIVAATEQIARYLHPGMVIVLESTTYPGTTTEVVLPILERNEDVKRRRDEETAFDASHPRILASSHPENDTGGRDDSSSEWQPRVGHDVFLAFSPERVDPGRTDWTTENTPKVIGGVTPACLEVASAFYGQAIQTLVAVSSPDAAEMAKIFENTFRSVNIGLANELLLMCDKLGLNAWEVLDAAATKPFGFMKFTPGPGLGGHCIPIDPLYLSWKMRTLQYTARFIELASEINTEMPRYWVQKVQDALNEAGKPVKRSRVLVVGVAYKKDVNDMRESPALDIIHLLQGKGAHVSYHDPHVPHFVYDGLEMNSVPDLNSALNEADCIVIVTDHSSYDWTEISTRAALIVDARHVIKS
jgi:UDP-N-acetyl-D-glucosamine dehydrogenase